MPATRPARSRALIALPERRPSAAMFSDEERQIIKTVIAPDLNEPELRAFLYLAASLNLNPVKRQIHAVLFHKNDPRRRRMVLITGIDGYRLKAGETGQYAGIDKPVYIYKAGSGTKTDPLNPLNIESCEITGYKFGPNGQRVSYTVEVFWDEYRKVDDVWEGPEGHRTKTGQRLAEMWAAMPRHMIAKCAEAKLLRAMLPADLAGVYVEDEVHVAAREGQLTGYSSAQLDSAPEDAAPPAPEPLSAEEATPELSDSPDWNATYAKIPLRVASAKNRAWFYEFLDKHFQLSNGDLLKLYGAREKLPPEVLERPMGETLLDIERRQTPAPAQGGDVLEGEIVQRPPIEEAVQPPTNSAPAEAGQ